MIDLEQFLYDRIKPVFDSWNEPDIYAVSFFVNSNECNEYRGFTNVTNFAVSYNTETACDGAGKRSEERWNYAFWPQEETAVFDSWQPTADMELLFDWYAQQGITGIGSEDDDMDAPVGFGELVEVLAKVARRFQDEGYWVRKLGRPIPIVIHDLEYIPCVMKATAYANPNGEAEDFLAEWEDAGSDFDDDLPGEDLRAVMGNVIAHLGDKKFMDRLLGIEQEASDDSDVEDLLKFIFEK